MNNKYTCIHCGAKCNDCESHMPCLGCEEKNKTKMKITNIKDLLELLKADEEYFLKRGYAELAHYVGALKEDLQKNLVRAKKSCSICDLDLSEGNWLYYEKQSFCICHFCYNDLALKGDKDEEDDE